jgi:thiol-disulfide isomerase/thioredoxin
LALATLASFVAVADTVRGAARHTLHAATSSTASHRLAPDFTLATPDGQGLRLSSYRGKSYFDFWATWCDPCREEIPHFVELQQKYGDRSLQTIGV